MYRPTDWPPEAAPPARPTYAALRAGERPAGERPAGDGGAGDADAAFDRHVVAAILAAAGREAGPLADGVGLAPAAIGRLVAGLFPGFDATGLGLDPGAADAPERDDEEAMLADLLARHIVAGPLAAVLPAMIARRAMRPDHLWQDLGLADRGELGRLLARHFPALHAGNHHNMRWKKYFYRTLCEAEGFVLCTAPSCAVCADFGACFGDEDGMSRLAATRRAHDSVGFPTEATSHETG